ncbi:MAG: radical SAM protein [Candidatus Bathyarchaeia archaeon]
MNILLVQPPTRPDLETLAALDMVAPSMGLAYLAAVLERANYKVEILDAPVYRMTFDQLRDEFVRRKPDIIGLTATTATINEALRAARIAEESSPDSKILLGGAHFTFTPEQTMRENPAIDIGCIGEGEETIVELVKTIEAGGDLKQVKGIVFRRDGELVRTPPRPLIANLDSLPFPARHLLPMGEYRAFGKKRILGTILTSRGCPFQCVFCSSSLLFGKKFRARSPKNVVDEVEEFQQAYKAPYVEFVDDTFTLDRKRAEAICDEIKRRKLGTVWVCSTRVDILTRELLETLKSAGCVMIYFGVESGVQRVLDLMKKGIKVEQSIRCMKWARELGIKTVASFVIGMPGETKEEIEQTIRFAKKLDPDYAQFSVATPYPGTELYEMAKEQGLLLTENWSRYTVIKPVLATREFTEEELTKLLKKAYLRFYLRPKVLWRYIKGGQFKEMIVQGLGTYFKRSLRLPRVMGKSSLK